MAMLELHNFITSNLHNFKTSELQNFQNERPFWLLRLKLDLMAEMSPFALTPNGKSIVCAALNDCLPACCFDVDVIYMPQEFLKDLQFEPINIFLGDMGLGCLLHIEPKPKHFNQK